MLDVIVIGGGLAGLTATIDLAKKGYKVCLIEKNQYPFHKVCGEFISTEVLPYLEKLGLNRKEFETTNITQFRLSSPKGHSVNVKLPVPSFGVSRYSLDYYLSKLAIDAGAKIRDKTTVDEVEFNNNVQTIKLIGGEELTAKLVIGSYGKRSGLDRKLNRSFFTERSPYIGVKYHMEFDIPEELVSLHNFKDGYCGVSMIEERKVNVCYLTTRANLKKYGSIPEMEKNVLYKNPHLKKLFTEGKHLYDKPKVINEISFAPKNVVDNHILMSGDAAGMIPPLAGNGMAMAIHSSYFLCEMIESFLEGNITRNELEGSYTKMWNSKFKARLFFGRQFQPLFGKEFISDTSLLFLKVFPFFLPFIVKQIHKEPFLKNV
jgi:flavin-dependent dehydrogenase